MESLNSSETIAACEVKLWATDLELKDSQSVYEMWSNVTGR